MATYLSADLRPSTAGGPLVITRHRRLPTFLISSRVRILGWFVVLIAAAIGVSLLVQRQVLVHRFNDGVDTQLTSDADDLTRLARNSRPSSVSALFDTYLRAHAGARDEELVAIVGGRAVERSASPTNPAYSLETMPGLVTRLSGIRTTVRGALSTGGGPARYLAVPVTQPGSQPGTFVAAYFTGPGMSQINGDVAVAAAVSLSTLLVMSLLAWLVAGRVLAPVRLMTDTARSISESDLARRIPSTSGDDEIGRLADTFNAMLDRLEAAFVSQRNFVTDAGHELRTPITVVKGHLELLGDDPAEREETMALVNDELNRMSRMVDDLLLLAKAERPGFLRMEPVDLGDLTHELLAKLQALAPRRWCAEVVSSAVTMADRQRLTQAVMNLVANALRYTGEDDAITLRLEVVGGEYRLSVADTGAGIVAEDQARIFERFARGRSERRRSQGSGLGLAIVRAIVEAHRGRVDLTSAPGMGATFTLTIPLQPPGEDRT